MTSSIEASQQIRAKFTAPLEHPAHRRIVIWHDPDGSFEEQFLQLANEDVDSERRVLFDRADGGSAFELKRRIYRTEADADFLIYERAHKDLSERGLAGNWLADVEIMAEHFQADFATMLANELGATEGAVEGVGEFRDFFNAATRRERFKRLMPHAQSKRDVALGVIGTAIAAPNLSTESIVRTYLCALRDGAGPFESLERYGAAAAFASFVSKRTGYVGDLTSADDMAAHLLLTALSFQMPEGSLAGLEGRISAPHGQFCLNIAHAWMSCDGQSGTLYDICRRVEGLCNLEARFTGMDSRQLADADVLPCINERILCDLFVSLANGADRVDEATSLIQRRKNLRWFSRVEPFFAALEAAVAAQAFYRSHTQGFHYAVPADVWEAYTADWYRMDTSYRSFCQAFDSCQKSDSDLPTGVKDGLDALAGWMERVYVNWFLADSNACWVAACEESWIQAGHIEGVPRQNRFYLDKIFLESGGAKKTMVIISDALRYEVAVELAERLERDTIGSAELASMQGTFPTITEFGMAALLPHKAMELRESDGGIYLDGMPTASTEQREAVLAAAKPSAVCIQSKKLMLAKRPQRREMVAGSDLVYVYHNTIDAIGEEFSTENKVFVACSEAIDDITALVKTAANDLNFARVLVTADHGFLYTRDPLEERDKVSTSDIDGEKLKLGRRYAVCRGFDPDAMVFVKMNMSDVDGGEYTGLAPRECIRIKKAGPGDNYVHGGVSLQEMCVPVVEFRNKRAGQKGYEERTRAELRLITTNRCITSMLFRVDLFQPQPAEGKVLSAEYELAMTDSSGNEVSDARRAHADMTTPDETARVTRVQLGLKAGRQYNPHASYYLICRDLASGEIAWKEEFQIDIAFVPIDDFGF